MMSNPNPSRHAPGEVDAYLGQMSEDVRACLQRVRAIIKQSAPACTERVSYGIPIFRLQTDLVGLSAQKKHCSLHTMSPQLVDGMADALIYVKVSGATIRFFPSNPLPAALIEAIVQARMAESA